MVVETTIAVYVSALIVLVPGKHIFIWYIFVLFYWSSCILSDWRHKAYLLKYHTFNTYSQSLINSFSCLSWASLSFGLRGPMAKWTLITSNQCAWTWSGLQSRDDPLGSQRKLLFSLSPFKSEIVLSRDLGSAVLSRVSWLIGRTRKQQMTFCQQGLGKCPIYPGSAWTTPRQSWKTLLMVKIAGTPAALFWKIHTVRSVQYMGRWGERRSILMYITIQILYCILPTCGDHGGEASTVMKPEAGSSDRDSSETTAVDIVWPAVIMKAIVTDSCQMEKGYASLGLFMPLSLDEVASLDYLARWVRSGRVVLQCQPRALRNIMVVLNWNALG